MARRSCTISDAALLADLSRVAGELKQTALSQRDYSAHGKYSFITVCRRFGGWKAALLRIDLEPGHFMGISEGELIADILRVAGELATTRLRYRQYLARGKYSRKVGCVAGGSYCAVERGRGNGGGEFADAV